VELVKLSDDNIATLYTDTSEEIYGYSAKEAMGKK